MARIIRVYTQIKVMVLENVPLQMLSINHLEGESKTSGKKYDFYLAKVMDEQGNLFEFALDKELENEKIDYDGIKNVPVLVRLRLYSSGNGRIKGNIEDLTEKL